MTALWHCPEPRPANGGLAAEGALNLLGRPAMDPLVVLIREAVQNSWDARSGAEDQVEFAVGLQAADEEMRAALNEEVFAEKPPRGLFTDEVEGRVELAEALRAADLGLLTLTDRGTSGLGGPVRADVPPPLGESSDFVDLVFNIGQPPDKRFGGGTYGFGKTISYLVSTCRTVIIHTAVLVGRRHTHRLIAQAMGNQYSYRGRNHTGRHWWGVPREHGVEPLTGEQAAQLAERLRLPQFAGGTGTTIAIVAPGLRGRTPRQAATFMANAIAWNFWPKMIAEAGARPSMTFSVTCEDEVVQVPDPEAVPPLKAYVAALRAVRDCESGRRKAEDFPTMRINQIRSRRPKELLGWLALHSTPAEERPVQDEGVDEEGEPASAAAFIDAAHHVANMRRAELIVQYSPGPELPSPVLEWSGVFKSSEAADEAFAEAEPPTHDDWQPELVAARRQKTFVNVGLREIRDAVTNLYGAAPAPAADQVRRSAVLVADALGQLIASTSGTGASRPPREPRPGAGPRHAPGVHVAGQRLELDHGRALLLVEFAVAPAAGSAATEIRATAAVAAADGSSAEAEPPVGAPTPEILGFRRGGEHVEGDQLVVPATDEQTWTLVIATAEAAATMVDLRPAAISGPAS